MKVIESRDNADQEYVVLRTRSGRLLALSMDIVGGQEAPVITELEPGTGDPIQTDHHAGNTWYKVEFEVEKDPVFGRFEATAVLLYKESVMHSALRYGSHADVAREKAIGAMFEEFGRHLREDVAPSFAPTETPADGVPFFQMVQPS
jgi:hypothetical protein